MVEIVIISKKKKKKKKKKLKFLVKHHININNNLKGHNGIMNIRNNIFKMENREMMKYLIEC